MGGMLDERYEVRLQFSRAYAVIHLPVGSIALGTLDALDAENAKPEGSLEPSKEF